jgi:integrase
MLTEVQIKNAKPREKAYRLYDERGMYIEIRPYGGKAFRLKYRFEGKERYMSLGVWPETTLKEAREKRDAARKQVAAKIDPIACRRAEKATAELEKANAFEPVAREWFLRHSPNWAESHAKTVIRRLEMDIFPWLGNKAIAEITAPELLGVIRKVEGRGALETAHRELNICSQIFRYAVATGRADRDPSGDLRGALPPVKSQHLAAVTDPKRLGEILRMIDTFRGTPPVRAALRLTPLFFVRAGELRTALWRDIDFENAQWNFFVTKTKSFHVVPLARQAVEILIDLHLLTGRGEYVFPNGRSRQRPMSENGVLYAIRSLGIDKDEMSGHGFRATARTLLDEVLGFRPELIEHQLAHAVKDPLGRAYNRTHHLDQRREMMQVWADYLDELKGGQA